MGSGAEDAQGWVRDICCQVTDKCSEAIRGEILKRQLGLKLEVKAENRQDLEGENKYK